MAKRWLAAGALAVGLALGASSPAIAASSGGCLVNPQGDYGVCATESTTSPQLAETGSVLGHVEIIVGATGGALLVGSALLVCATRRTTQRESRR
ncbi:hypothetical protein HDC94_002276 [Leifsonia sp. AK011]|uniref:hypothetical protein n=1 Tax=Leifsonia sp. AK011 TaxID=2723075 RepID=UPI0015C99B6E|nr:hypothetical protein [Leifsonia sp. AK011]NYF11120.1 hypothetical protein [Leifsonia sp. AK011]